MNNLRVAEVVHIRTPFFDGPMVVDDIEQRHGTVTYTLRSMPGATAFGITLFDTPTLPMLDDRPSET